MMAAAVMDVSETDYFSEQTTAFKQHQSLFLEFLDTNEDVYRARVIDMLKSSSTRLILDVNDLRAYDTELGRRFLKKPLPFLPAFQAAVKTFTLRLADLPISPPDNATYMLGLTGSFGAHRVTPRQLSARMLSSLVCVEGIVTRCSVVRPKVVRSVHHCEKTQKMKEMIYHDATSLTGFPTGSAYPTKDEDGNPYTTEFGLSEYMDHQLITIQEMPERAPAGLLPSSVECVLDMDLVDRCKPGDRIQVVGVYRALASRQQGQTSGLFRSIVIGNNVQLIGKQAEQSSKMSESDLKSIKRLGKNPNIFDLLSGSVAPSIYGHAEIKKALTLLLFGGVEHNLENGTHLRGDINMLMVGDPSTAKSQLLRFVLNIAPLAINTTGRGSSGVGLTAAVTQDKDTGERRLEAGAMVLADRGVVCIDEFDKMSDGDRVAIHEVMEQQTVTIAKAGIHMSLNARCSVVAAANPLFGNYQSSKTPMENVNLPDSLLSRFDLLFIVLDNVDEEVDRAISDHVLRNHRYRSRAGYDPFAEPEDDMDQEEEETPVFQKYDRMLHQGSTLDKILSLDFLKKYIAYCKKTFSPILTEEASEAVSEAYAALREQESMNSQTLPITARSLETLIRLSSAHAKCRMSKKVTKHDVDIALELMVFAIHHSILEEEEEDTTGDTESDSDDSGDSGDDPFQLPAASSSSQKKKKKQQKQPPPKSPQAKKKRVQPLVQPLPLKDVYEKEEEEEEEEEDTDMMTFGEEKPLVSRKSSSKRKQQDDPPAPKKQKTQPPSTARIAQFTAALMKHVQQNKLTSSTVDYITEVVNKASPARPFEPSQVHAILEHLDTDERIFYRPKEGKVHFI